MGGCLSAAVPTPKIDGARVAKVVAKRGAEIVLETRSKFNLFKDEMKRYAPNHYLVPKDWTAGHEVTLTEGKDDDKKVRSVALTAASGDKIKEETRNDVWNEVEPDVASQVSEHNELVRKGALAAAHKASDKAADAALDALIKKLMKQIEEGKDVSDPEAPADTTASAAAHPDEKKEHHEHEHETEKKEQENAV